MSVNKVILIGRLGKDPEIKSVNSTKVASFSIAVDDSYKDKNGNKVEQVDWINVVIWRNLAEVVERYVKRGMKVCICGKLKTRSWEKDGQKHFATEVVADQLEMLDGKDSSTPGQAPTEPAQRTASGTPMSTFEPEEPDENDLPF